MNKTLIKAFGVCTTESTPVENYQEFFLEAIKRGYLIPKEIANQDMVEFLALESIDYNSTFYENWIQVRDSSRLEQAIDQMLHYMTNGAYVVNNTETPDIDITTYKVIEVATIEDVFQRCLDMIYSGIALSGTMIDAIINYISIHYNEMPEGMFDIDKVKNRDAKNRLRIALNIRPTTGIDLLKWIVYLTTGQSNIVKSREVINYIREACCCKYNNVFDFNNLTNNELVELSKIFYRFKSIFLAFRDFENNRPIINKIRRMAKHNHVPMADGYWQTILSKERDIEDVKIRVSSLSTFKIVSLIQTIFEKERIYTSGGRRLYFIRNGKIWMSDEKDENTPVFGPHISFQYGFAVTNILMLELKRRLREKAGSVRFPKNINLVCPTSEKQFAGPLPYGSYYNLSEHNYFGIYWKEADGTRDFDLSFISDVGNKVGWNANYNVGDGEVMFSGDMVRAVPEASEVLYFKKGSNTNGTIYINRFNGRDGSKYKYYFGQEKITNLDKGYMVDPNCIEFTEETTSNSRQEMLGMIYDNRIYLCKFGNGQGFVSSGKYAKEKLKAQARKLESCLNLKEILLSAGFTEWDEDERMWDEETKTYVPTKPDYDFTNLDKDTLISLFS